MQKRNCLEGVANEIFPNTDISVGLLIGTNRAKALKPKEVIPSRESGAYAVKTILDLERAVPIQLRQSLVGVSLGQYPVLVKIQMRSAAIVFQWKTLDQRIW